MYNKGRWSAQEHKLFIQAVRVHGLNWELVHRHVPTRTKVQCRTHGQKYFLKYPLEKKIASFSVQEQNAVKALLRLKHVTT